MRNNGRSRGRVPGLVDRFGNHLASPEPPPDECGAGLEGVLPTPILAMLGGAFSKFEFNPITQDTGWMTHVALSADREGTVGVTVTAELDPPIYAKGPPGRLHAFVKIRLTEAMIKAAIYADGLLNSGGQEPESIEA